MKKECWKLLQNGHRKVFFELKIYNHTRLVLLPKDLESFFISWGNRLPQKPLNLIICINYNNHGFEFK